MQTKTFVDRTTVENFRTCWKLYLHVKLCNFLKSNRMDDGDMIKFLETLSVSKENLSTSSLIQIVNHGISFGEHVNDTSLTDELLKRLSGIDVKSLSINELKKVLKYLMLESVIC